MYPFVSVDVGPARDELAVFITFYGKPVVNRNFREFVVLFMFPDILLNLLCIVVSFRVHELVVALLTDVL